MSRSGYDDDCNNWSLIRWRGAVRSAIRGRRGQAFLKEAKAALEELPERKLFVAELEDEGCYCTLGAVGRKRGLPMQELDPDDIETTAHAFGLPRALACEVVFENDDAGPWRETPEERWHRMHMWIAGNIAKEAA